MTPSPANRRPTADTCPPLLHTFTFRSSRLFVKSVRASCSLRVCCILHHRRFICCHGEVIGRYFAQQADVEGQPDVAAVFRSTAEGKCYDRIVGKGQARSPLAYSLGSGIVCQVLCRLYLARPLHAASGPRLLRCANAKISRVQTSIGSGTSRTDEGAGGASKALN